MGPRPLTETSNQLAVILKGERWIKSPHLYLGPSISPLPVLPPGKQSRSQRTSRLTGSQRSTSQDPEQGGGGTQRDKWKMFSTNPQISKENSILALHICSSSARRQVSPNNEQHTCVCYSLSHVQLFAAPGL